MNRQKLLWTLENREVAIGIDQATGLIRSLLFKQAKSDLFQQFRGGIPGYAGGLRIYDELDRRWYSDLTDEFTLSGAKADDRSISFTKRFSGAPFALRVTLTLDRGALDWHVEAHKTKASVADRSLRVHFQMPVIAGWQVWAPCKGGEEFTFDGMTSFEFMYVQVPWVSDYEVILPMTSHFNRDLDVGYSLVEPIDAKVPAAKFQFANGETSYAWGAFAKDPGRVPYLEAVNYFIGLIGARPMSTRIQILFHEGCWRPALGQVFERWKEYFVPPNPRMYEHEGVFECSRLERNFKAAGTAKLKTFEVHDHFEMYGIYFPEKEKWLKNSVRESLWKHLRQSGARLDERGLQDWILGHADREIARIVVEQYNAGLNYAPALARKPFAKWTDCEVDEFLYWTRERIHRRLAEARQNGISPFWYFNYSDAFRPEAEARWPDALCRHEDGSILPSGWMMCHCLNSDPAFSLGKHLLAEARKIVREYPELAGFFLDCFRHYEIDFAHDDGVTVVNHKPAYSVNFSYDTIEGKLREILLPQGLCTFANKPQTLRTMRWCDGMMLEGNGDQFEEKYFWAALAKPIIFLWTTAENSVDENYRRSVLHGCFPKLASRSMNAADLRLQARYLPLCEAFRRRVFCFDPDPIRVPKGSRAKLYTVGKDYVAGIMSPHIDQGDRIRYRGVPSAVFRVQRGADIGKVGVMFPGDKTWRFVKFRFTGTFLVVPLERYENCAVVKLFVTKKTGKKIKNIPFPKVIDMCGDPKSSFEDLSAL